VRYELHRSGRALLIGIPLLVTAVCVAGICAGPTLDAVLFGVGASLLMWVSYLDVPYALDLRSDDTAQFWAITRRRVVAFRDIKYIGACRWSGGFVRLRSSRVRVAVFRNMPGVRELLEAVRRSNPAAVIRGGV
jgi:hypothetical protein